jgi:hypothetical protein
MCKQNTPEFTVKLNFVSEEEELNTTVKWFVSEGPELKPGGWVILTSFTWFLQSLRANVRIVPQIWPEPLPYISFPVDYSVTVIPCNSI